MAAMATSQGALVHAPVAVFDPINIAAAGFHGAADAHQSNTVQFLQGASQAAGGGGHGGDGNAAIGGDVSVLGAGATATRSSGPATRPQARDLAHDLDHDLGRPPPENFSARTDRVRTC
jgi:hypothetical protein